MGDERARGGAAPPVSDGMALPVDDRPVTWRMRLGRFLLGLGGWRAVGRMPDVPKCVALGAPHTSNWDFVLMLPLGLAIDARITWMGKDSLFRWPLGWVMRRLGGFPVQRGARLNAVEQAIQRFRETDHLVLVMSPEGTRRRTEAWKSGFYHIARGAGVPVVLGFLDYARKEAGIGPAVTLTGDRDADLRTIAAFYADKRGRYPEQETPIRLSPAAS